MYVLNTDDQGRLSEIDNVADDKTFDANPDLAEYKVMIDWIGRYAEPALDLTSSLPPDSRIFLSRHDVVEYCKQHGLLLYAVDNEVPFWKDSHHGGVQFCHLSVGYSQSQAHGANTDSGIIPHNTNLAVLGAEWRRLNDDLLDEDSNVRHVSSLPVKRAFVYLDVSDFSKYKAGEEALIINSLSALVSDADLWSGRATSVYRKFKTMLCIGDGYIFVFADPVRATYFAAYLAQLIEVLIANNALPVEFHFRMGAHVGLVYSFWDPGRDNWNYVGAGINGGNRVLAAVGKDQDDVLFVSSDVRKAIQAAQSDEFDCQVILASLTNRGRKADKHGFPWRVYEVNHTELCANDVPRTLRREVSSW